MINNPQWNKYEAALLLEALLKVKERHFSAKEVVANISNRFRDKALLDKKQISDTYRNKNGISLQLGAMDYAYTNGARGIKHVSKLFYEIVDLYHSDPKQFNSILECAKEIFPYEG